MIPSHENLLHCDTQRRLADLVWCFFGRSKTHAFLLPIEDHEVVTEHELAESIHASIVRLIEIQGAETWFTLLVRVVFWPKCHRHAAQVKIQLWALASSIT